LTEIALIAQFRDIVRYREALRHMVARDLKVRYSYSVLGVAWGLLSPLLMTLVYSVVFSFLVPTTIESFPVFILAGLLPWQFFSTTLVSTTGAITANAMLINRVYFPREVLPLANLLSNAVNFLLALVMLFVFILVFRVPLTVHLLWLPVLITLQVALTMGLGLFLSTVNVFFRDTQQIVDIVTLAWFFLTPVIYPLDSVPAHLRLLFQTINPMAGLVVAYRDILYYGHSPNQSVLAIVTALAVLSLLLGSLTFRRLSPAFAEEV
jgi:lipopolysaccharide transport system permease protein